MSKPIETGNTKHPDLLRGGEEEIDRFVQQCTESFTIFPLLEGIHTGLTFVDSGEKPSGGRILGGIQEYIQSVGICTKRFYSYERSDGNQNEQRREILAVSDDILRFIQKSCTKYCRSTKKRRKCGKIKTEN